MRTEGDKFLLIRQTDHAELSGVFARHWGNDTFARPEPFDSFCLASALHDNGWHEWEATPKIDPQSLFPYQFTDLPVEEHLQFYLRGVERVLEKDRYAGLLVSMHCSGIYKQRYGTDPSLKLRRFTPDVERVVQGFMDRLENQQRELRVELRSMNSSELPARSLEDKVIWANYRLLQIMDRLSLYFCMAPITQRWLGPVPVKKERGDADLTLRPVSEHTVEVFPYPFDNSPLRVSVDARVIPKQECKSDEHFCELLAQARATSLSFDLRAEPSDCRTSV